MRSEVSRYDELKGETTRGVSRNDMRPGADRKSPLEKRRLVKAQWRGRIASRTLLTSPSKSVFTIWGYMAAFLAFCEHGSSADEMLLK